MICLFGCPTFGSEEVLLRRRTSYMMCLLGVPRLPSDSNWDRENPLERAYSEEGLKRYFVQKRLLDFKRVRESQTETAKSKRGRNSTKALVDGDQAKDEQAEGPSREQLLRKAAAHEKEVTKLLRAYKVEHAAAPSATLQGVALEEGSQ